MLMHLALLVAQGNGGAPSVSPITTLIVGLSAAVVGSLLSLIGGFVSDFFASRREERRLQREDHNRREQHEREDRLRREQQDYEERLRVTQSRVQAYQAFTQAATFADYVPASDREGVRVALNRAYIEVQLYASDN
jgi:cell shape-determining protein MreC